MTRPRRDDRQRLFLTTALTNPAIREIEAEGSDPAPLSDVFQAAAFGAIAGGCALLVAHGLALTLTRSGYAMQLVAFGAVALVGFLIRAGQIADSRRTRQWATFERHPEPAKAPEFVPVTDSRRTLVLDTPLRRKLTQWAQILPTAGYALAYPNWTGRGKVFSRAEYEHVRRVLKALNYEADNALTERGRMAIGRWAAGNYQARELHLLRTTPADEDNNVSG